MVMTRVSRTLAMRHHRGFSAVEYCVLIALTAAVLVGLVPYITGAVAGRVRDIASEIGSPYFRGRTTTTGVNRLTMNLTRTERVFQTSNESLADIPALIQPGLQQDYIPTSTVSVSADQSRSNIVVTTSNQTVTQERHETSTGIVGAPTAP